jgi:hypothetical protein
VTQRIDTRSDQNGRAALQKRPVTAALDTLRVGFWNVSRGDAPNPVEGNT